MSAAGAHPGNSSIGLAADSVFGKTSRVAKTDLERLLLTSAGNAVATISGNAMIQSFGLVRSYPTVSYYEAFDPHNSCQRGFSRIVSCRLAALAAKLKETLEENDFTRDRIRVYGLIANELVGHARKQRIQRTIARRP